MDYDMFLITRIYEYRWRGLSTKAAVVRGLARTGSVITTAGIIMMIAFSALMLSNQLILNEFGFALVFASFFDTVGDRFAFCFVAAVHARLRVANKVHSSRNILHFMSSQQFIVRPLFVPSLMLLFEQWNWWPGDVPPVIKDEFDGYESDEDGGFAIDGDDDFALLEEMSGVVSGDHDESAYRYEGIPSMHIDRAAADTSDTYTL